MVPFTIKVYLKVLLIPIMHSVPISRDTYSYCLLRSMAYNTAIIDLFSSSTDSYCYYNLNILQMKSISDMWYND